MIVFRRLIFFRQIFATHIPHLRLHLAREHATPLTLVLAYQGQRMLRGYAS